MNCRRKNRFQKHVYCFNKNFTRILFPFLLLPVSIYAQDYPVYPVNNEAVVELEAVQTPAHTFVTTLMGTAYYDNIRVYRSSDMGISWNNITLLGSDSIYIMDSDPVLTADNCGNLFAVFMKRPSDLSCGHLQLSKSVDDGLSWNSVSDPYTGKDEADYPQIVSRGNGKLYLSYTLYSNDFYINFTCSQNGGVTWSPPKIFNSIPGINFFLAVGSDLNWLAGNKLCLAFGDYISDNVYFTSSSDFGNTWTPVKIIPGLTDFTVNKIVSHKNYNHLGIISHHPHSNKSKIFYSNSLDGGDSWQSQVLDSVSAYGEGVIGNDGSVNIIYNHTDPQDTMFHLEYVYSTDMGQLFSAPFSLYSAKNVIAGGIGEYQSLILASDSLFHLTFIDWSDGAKAKQIIFWPLLLPVENIPKQEDLPFIFPNPAKEMITIMNKGKSKWFSYDILSLSGIIINSGSLSGEQSKLDISGLATGTYLIRVFSENRIFIQKLIKYQ